MSGKTLQSCPPHDGPNPKAAGREFRAGLASRGGLDSSLAVVLCTAMASCAALLLARLGAGGWRVPDSPGFLAAAGGLLGGTAWLSRAWLGRAELSTPSRTTFRATIGLSLAVIAAALGVAAFAQPVFAPAVEPEFRGVVSAWGRSGSGMLGIGLLGGLWLLGECLPAAQRPAGGAASFLTVSAELETSQQPAASEVPFAAQPLEPSFDLLDEATEEPGEDEDWGPDVSQLSIRRELPDGGEAVEMRLRVPFRPGERTRQVHVAFCPPLAGIPEIECETADGPEGRVKVAQALTCGARIEVRLVQEPMIDRCLTLHLAATFSPAAPAPGGGVVL